MPHICGALGLIANITEKRKQEESEIRNVSKVLEIINLGEEMIKVSYIEILNIFFPLSLKTYLTCLLQCTDVTWFKRRQHLFRN